MKWILLVFLLISCNSEDEDMKLFISSLGSESGGGGFILPPDGVRVLILTGQSNAYGAVPNADADPSELLPHPNVQIWNHNGDFFEDLHIGVNNDGGAAGGTVPQFAYEIGYQDYFNDHFPNEILYLIKRAAGGTCIIRHLEGGDVYTPLWNNYVKLGINDLLAQGKRPFVYFVFSQGECDSNTTEDTNAYSGRFDTFTDLWQTNLGADLPFNIVEIYESDADDLVINNVFKDKALNYNPMKVINTEGMPSDDNLHYNYVPVKEIANITLSNMVNQTPVEITAPL